MRTPFWVEMETTQPWTSSIQYCIFWSTCEYRRPIDKFYSHLSNLLEVRSSQHVYWETWVLLVILIMNVRVYFYHLVWIVFEECNSMSNWVVGDNECDGCRNRLIKLSLKFVLVHHALWNPKDVFLCLLTRCWLSSPVEHCWWYLLSSDDSSWDWSQSVYTPLLVLWIQDHSSLVISILWWLLLNSKEVTCM